MRVISWNMGQATGGFRQPGLHDQAWHYLLGLGPDLAFLQEAQPPSWVRSEGQLVRGPFKQWGSVIFSPVLPLAPVSLPHESPLRTLGSYLAVGSASLPDGTDAFITSVHARPAAVTARQLGGLDPAVLKREGTGAAKVNDLVFFGLRDLVGTRFIVAGDWNTGRKQGSASGKKAGAEFFDRVRARGWYDCVHDKLDDGELRTWFREGDQLIQNDHVFCDPALGQALGEPWAAEEAASVLKLSDHAPLVLDFDVPPISMTSLQD